MKQSSERSGDTPQRPHQAVADWIEAFRYGLSWSWDALDSEEDAAQSILQIAAGLLEIPEDWDAAPSDAEDMLFSNFVPDEPDDDQESEAAAATSFRDKASEFEDLGDGDPSKSVEELQQHRRAMLNELANHLLQLCHQAGYDSDSELDQQISTVAEKLYQRWRDHLDYRIQGTLLQCLTWNRRSDALVRYCTLISEQPPNHWMATATSLSPLLRSRDWELRSVFPSLLQGLMHPTTIAPILDVCNWVRRSNLVAEHPALALRQDLIGLLGEVVGRLGRLEEHPEEFGETVEQIQWVLGESIALCIALCDTVGWFGDATAVGKLHQAITLRHRRIQTEAAAALAKLNEPIGKQRLLELVSDPSARLRVLAYAEELGFESEIDEQFSVPAARAEAELATWLGQSENFGLAPSQLELVDDRLLYWPGYDEPQQAYLFRYTYELQDASLSNIGIAGPLVYAFHADLGNLPMDDIYAVFAGWHVEHPELFEIDVNHLNTSQRTVADQLVAYLQETEHQDVRPLFLGFILGDIALVARSTLHGSEGIVVTDGRDTNFQPTSGRLRPLGPAESYYLYRGRKILRAFNP